MLKRMAITKFYSSLILFLFFFNYVKSEESNDESLWRTLANGVYSVLPWNWYGSSSSTDAELEYVKPEFKNTKEQSSSETIPVILFDDENDKAYQDEKLKTISFSDFMEKMDIEIAAEGKTNSENILNIFKSVKDAIVNNKLCTDVALGGKKILVSLGVLDSEERTKNLEQCDYSLLIYLNWLMQILYSLLFWLPGIQMAHTPSPFEMQNKLYPGTFQINRFNSEVKGNAGLPEIDSTNSKIEVNPEISKSNHISHKHGELPSVTAAQTSLKVCPTSSNFITSSSSSIPHQNIRNSLFSGSSKLTISVNDGILRNVEENFIILKTFQNLFTKAVAKIEENGKMDENLKSDIENFNDKLLRVSQYTNVLKTHSEIPIEFWDKYNSEMEEILNLAKKLGDNSKLDEYMPIKMKIYKQSI